MLTKYYSLQPAPLYFLSPLSPFLFYVRIDKQRITFALIFVLPISSTSSLMESTTMEPDSGFSDPSSTGFSSDLIIPNPKSARPSSSPPLSSSAAPSPKRSRRSAEKRVVSIPISEADVSSRAKGVSECAPPSDSWAWRKYGQKPIKGSPYPRGYYRCSSSKGCPARKQVERSRVDPTMLLVTYTCDHNHTTHSANTNKRASAVKEELSDPDADLDPTTQSPPESAVDSKFSDLIGPDAFWYADLGSTSSTSAPGDTLLYGSIFVGCAELAPEENDNGNIGGDDVDSSLFDGLGELPEYSTVFRRSYWERQLAVHTAVHQ